MPSISKVVLPFVAAGLVAAAPATLDKRDAFVNTYGDANVFQYALTLEHLERAFYRDSLNKFSAADFSQAGYPDWVRQRFTEIASHEKTHVDFITAALTAAGATPVAECTYDFGVNRVDQFVALSSTLEGVGVAAYLGAAPSIKSPDFLGYAGDVLVVETQHSTWVNSAVQTKDGFPRAFAAGLDFNQVYTLAAGFIKSCPASNPTLPFYTFPPIENKSLQPSYKVGDTVKFQFDQSIVDTANKKGQTLYAAFVAAAGTQYVQLNSNCGEIKIPPGIGGQSYVVVLNGKFLCDPATVAGPLIVEVEIPASNVAYN